MEQVEIFKPMMVQAGLMIVLAFWLVWARIGSLVRGKITIEGVAKTGWQGWIKNAGDNYSNQYELPLLFFTLCIVLYLTNSVTQYALILAWIFALTRIVHALVHLSVNIIMLRFVIFLTGALALTALFGVTAMAIF